jgi:hypothetical protein
MNTITIPKKEYKDLVEKRMRYEYLRHILEADIFSSPPTRSRQAIIRVFKTSKRYNQKFLRSLEKGLKRSSYFNA